MTTTALVQMRIGLGKLLCELGNKLELVLLPWFARIRHVAERIIGRRDYCTGLTEDQRRDWVDCLQLDE